MKYLSYLFLFLISIQSFAYDFDNLFNQMNADISETNDKAMKARLKENNSIKAYCNSLKRLPFSWKEDFSRENRININSITFLGATLREGTYSSDLMFLVLLRALQIEEYVIIQYFSLTKPRGYQMNAFFNLKIILILTLTLSSNFSYAGLKDKFNEQQKPKTNSIPQEVLDIRDDINNTWDAIRKEGTFYYVMEGDNIENYTTDIGSFWRYKQNFIDDVFPVVRLGNRVLLPLHIPEVNEKGVVWKGKTLSCDTSRIKRYTEVSFARPTPIGKIDKGGTASFKMEYLQSDYHMPKRSSSFSIERDFEVNFDTNECYTLYKSGSVQKCHITTFAEIADYKKSNYINGKNNTEGIYNKLYLNNSNLKYCKVQ